METRDVTEKRKFKAHEKLLLDVIKRQAGSLSKGILEAVMNAVDAKATFVNIRIDSETVLISDDGQGFGTKEQLIHVFEVFGQPHDEAEDKLYGAFRCGRGQLFCYGVNEWKTGQFRMTVNINKGLDYELLEKQKHVDGCKIRIKLYDRFSELDQLNVARDIERWCKYAPIKVYFNDKLVSKDPAKDRWDIVTDEAFIRLNNSGTLSLYNLGIHVCELSNYKFGTGGTVVSRKQLKVNFARNDVQSDCPVWKKIVPEVNRRATARNTEKKTMDDGARQRLVDQFATGQLSFTQLRNLNVITAVTGRQLSPDQLMRYDTISSARRGSVLGDRMVRQNIAMVVADETLERFGVETVAELVKLLKDNYRKIACEYMTTRSKVKAFAELTAGISDHHTILLDSELTPTEQRWQRLMRWAMGELALDPEATYASREWVYRTRRLVIGTADKAAGWTDGATYVALERKFLAARSMDIQGITDVIVVLIHEACHHSPDNVDHDHDQEFYELFHDMTQQYAGACVQRAINKLPEIVKAVDAKISKRNARVLDKLQAVTAATKGAT